MLFRLFLLVVFIGSLNGGDISCPYPACSSSFNIATNSCDITCTNHSLGSIGQPKTLNITSFQIFYLQNASSDLFKDMNIGVLRFINCLFTDITENIFNGVEKVSKISFENVVNLDKVLNKNLSLTNKIDRISINRYLNLNTILSYYNLMNYNYYDYNLYSYNYYTIYNSNVYYYQYSNFSKTSFTYFWDVIKGLEIKEFLIQNMYLNELTSLDLRDIPSLVKLCVDSNAIKNISIKLNQNISYLSLFNNSIQEINLDVDQNISNLSTLILRQNRIVNISLRNHPKLVRLDLSRNQLDTFSNENIQESTLLQDLYLSMNRIFYFKLENGCFELTDLDLASNSLFNFILPSNLTKLTRLNLDSNLIEHIKFANLPKSFTQLTSLYLPSSLKSLEIDFNLFPNISSFTMRNGSLQNVTIFLSKNLTKLDLANNKLKSIQIDSSDQLTDLNLSINKLENIQLVNFTKLANLDLSYNKFSTFSNETLIGVSSLKTLNLGYNNISNFKMPNNMSSLESLNLASCRLYLFTTELLGDLPKLNELILSSNYNLSILELDLTKFSIKNLSLINTILKNVSIIINDRLDSLILDNNNITNLYLSRNENSTLNKLSLRNNLIEKIDFCYFKQLKYLDLYNNKIKSINNETFFECSSLTALNLEQNLIQTVQFGQMLNLTELNLKYNNLSMILLNSLGYMPQLSYLYLSYNPSLKEIDLNLSISKLTSLSITATSLVNASILVNKELSSLDLSNNIISKLFIGCLSSNSKLSSINLANNLIEEISLRNLTALNYLNLENNKLRVISDSNFKESLNLFKLYLDSNKIEKVNLEEMIENLRYLSLNNNLIQNISIDKFPSLQNLNIQYNNLSSISIQNHSQIRYLYFGFNQIQNCEFNNLPNLYELHLQNNLIQFCRIENLPVLTELNLAFNNLKSVVFTKENKDLKTNSIISNLNSLSILDLRNNLIENLEFGLSKSIQSLFLSFNKIIQLKEFSFKNLIFLKYLDLSSNQIKNIHPKSFDSNLNLRELNLDNNFLSSVPIITNLINLKILSMKNQNGNLKKLQNNAFQRDIDEADYLNSIIDIDLSLNSIDQVHSKVFCSDYSDSLAINTFTIRIDNMNIFDKCMLKQLASDIKTIVSTYYDTLINCDLINMAKNQNINLKDVPYTNCPQLNDDCSSNSNSKYQCSSSDFDRYVTWINGDPHVFSYKKAYQFCVIGQNKICFKNAYFTIYCSDKPVGKDPLATSLSNITVKLNEKIPGILDKVEFSEGSQVIYHAQTKTHIILVKWGSFYNLVLRATKQLYSENSTSGILVNGCENALYVRKKRQATVINEECDATCKNISSTTDSELVDPSIAYETCIRDCEIIGNSSFVKNVYQKTYAVMDVLQKSPENADLNTFSESFKQVVESFTQIGNTVSLQSAFNLSEQIQKSSGNSLKNQLNIRKLIFKFFILNSIFFLLFF